MKQLSLIILAAPSYGQTKSARVTYGKLKPILAQHKAIGGGKGAAAYVAVGEQAGYERPLRILPSAIKVGRELAGSLR